MKRLLLSTIFTAMLTATGYGQTIKPVTATFEDYLPILNQAGYQVYSFDISSLRDTTYNVKFVIKEFKDGAAVENGTRVIKGARNRTMLSDFDESDIASMQPEEIADPEAGVYSFAKKLNIGFIHKNDSTMLVCMELSNRGNLFLPLPLLMQTNPVTGESFTNYLTRPFKEFAFATDTFVPLVLLGSMWYDSKYNIFRFCGEDEIEPDMSSKILQDIPHYYIIGVKLSKKE